MPQAASTPQSGVSLPTVHTGDLDPLQLVLRDFLKNQAKKKERKSQTIGLRQVSKSKLSKCMFSKI